MPWIIRDTLFPFIQEQEYDVFDHTISKGKRETFQAFQGLGENVQETIGWLVQINIKI